MTSPGFLDFFILEASEYIEQLDGILLKGGTDVDAFVRNARGLRGSATMAKLTPFADVATALERVGRALHDRTLSWSPALTGAVTATVDELKVLLRSVRAWSPADDQRAAARSAELSRFAPARDPSSATTPSTASGAAFFASESANIAAGLELLATRPTDRDAAANVLRRVRAVRGVAGIKDFPPLPEVMEGAELTARPLELGEGQLAPERISALRAAAVLLRRAATALRDTGAASVPADERDAFYSALDSLQEQERGAGRGRVVPITELFFDDAGPHVVTTAPHPPTTPGERFRLEVVSQGEHLRGLVAEARRLSDRGADASSLERLRRELRHALVDLRNDAQSFGESEVAGLIATRLEALQRLDGPAMDSLATLGQALASPGAPGERLAARLAELAERAEQPIRQSPEASRSANGDTTVAPSEAPLRRPSGPVSSTAPTPVITPAIRARATAAPNVPGTSGAGASPVPPLSSRELERAPRDASPAPAASTGSVPSSPSAPTPVSLPPRATPGGTKPTPRGSQRVGTPRETMAVLDQGIDSLASLAAQPMSEPVDLPEQPLVPIDALLYRGRAALERATELREEIKRSGGTASPEALDELFDLLELAKSE